MPNTATGTAIMHSSSISLLRLLQLVSPTSPVGAYAYSQGMEQAVAWGWIETEKQVKEWICGILLNSILTQDAPILLRQYQAWHSKDYDKVLYWNQYLLACRETKELREEEKLLGQALARILLSLNLNDLQTFRQNCERQESMKSNFAISYCTAFSCAGVGWNIELNALLLGFCWTWAENQVMAALKLVSIGQSAGQRILSGVSDVLAAEFDACLNIDDDTITGALPGFANASAAHESLYSRLFRS